jgi:hypothetical protein
MKQNRLPVITKLLGSWKPKTCTGQKTQTPLGCVCLAALLCHISNVYPTQSGRYNRQGRRKQTQTISNEGKRAFAIWLDRC